MRLDLIREQDRDKIETFVNNGITGATGFLYGKSKTFIPLIEGDGSDPVALCELLFDEETIEESWQTITSNLAMKLYAKTWLKNNNPVSTGV